MYRVITFADLIYINFLDIFATIKDKVYLPPSFPIVNRAGIFAMAVVDDYPPVFVRISFKLFVLVLVADNSNFCIRHILIVLCFFKKDLKAVGKSIRPGDQQNDPGKEKSLYHFTTFQQLWVYNLVRFWYV